MSAKAALSEQEYLRTSFPGVDREYHDGELVERSVPDFFHSETQGNLSGFFTARRKTHRTFAAPGTRLCLRRGRYLIPDVSVFWPDRPTTAIPEAKPLIVVEILSPDDRMTNVREKLQEYVDWGVVHVWLVDPRKRRMYVCDHGLREVRSFHVPEVGLEVGPPDIFE